MCRLECANPLAGQAGLSKPLLALPDHPTGAVDLSQSCQAPAAGHKLKGVLVSRLALVLSN